MFTTLGFLCSIWIGSIFFVIGPMYLYHSWALYILLHFHWLILFFVSSIFIILLGFFGLFAMAPSSSLLWLHVHCSGFLLLLHQHAPFSLTLSPFHCSWGFLHYHRLHFFFLGSVSTVFGLIYFVVVVQFIHVFFVEFILAHAIFASGSIQIFSVAGCITSFYFFIHIHTNQFPVDLCS